MNKRYLSSSLLGLILLSTSGCSSAHVEWYPIENPRMSLPAAKTDCEFKSRQVLHTFEDARELVSFAFQCMAGHGYNGRWVQN